MVYLEHISLEEQFIEGTKIEANAHKYILFEKNQLKKNKEMLQGKIDAVLAEIG
jgi:hypothetical protein